MVEHKYRWISLLMALFWLSTYSLAFAQPGTLVVQPLNVTAAVYDQSVSSSYRIDWMPMSLIQPATPMTILDSFKSSGQISAYTVSNGKLTSISFESTTLSDSETVGTWACTVNDSIATVNSTLNVEDRVLFTYRKPLQPPSSTPSSSTPASSSEASSEALPSAPPSSAPISEPSSQQSSKALSSPNRSKTEISSSPDSNPTFEWTTEMSNSIDNACKWLSLNEKGQYYLISTGIAGKTADITASTRIQQEIIANNGNYASALSLGQDILSITFSGLNPEDFQGIDMIRSLYSFLNLKSQGTIALAHSLTVYDSNNYQIPDNAENTRNTIIKQLLEIQNEDGGFGVLDDMKSEIQVTAMAVTALSQYIIRDDVKQAVRSALTYFQENQHSDGSFGGQTMPTSEEISSVIVALSSLGLSMSDTRFVQNNQNLVNVLMSYQRPDGGFSSSEKGESETIATEQAVVALVAAQHQLNPYVVQNSLDYKSSPGQTSQSPQTESNFPSWLLAIPVIVVVAGAACFAVIKIRKSQTTTQFDQDSSTSDE